MACCHNVMLLLDTAGGAAGRSPVRRAALRLLTYLSCRFGLARVRWAFKFFDSQGARSRPSRVSDFRELGVRSWEDFEEELDAVLGDGAHGAHLPGPAPRASHTHGALMETLLDYQWDRPEITSPTKPILRSRGRRLLDVESEAKEAETALGGFANAVFLLAPCPHSQRELLQFVCGCEAEAQRLPPAPKQVMEKLLPKRVQEVMIARKITLYWVDTTEWPKLWESPDHLGYWTVWQLLHLAGGAVLPSETLSQDCAKAGEILRGGEKNLSSDSPLTSWISTLPSEATLNCLLYNSPTYEASFPRTEGTLFLPVEGKEIQEPWTVTLEPLAMHQRHFQKPVRIFLQGTAAQWSLPASSILGTDSWMLRSPEENSAAPSPFFAQLVRRLAAGELHLVASVDPGEGWPPVTGVISPLSTNATILTVFRTGEAEFRGDFLQTAVAENPQEPASHFSDVVDVVLSQIQQSREDPAARAPPVPAWAQRELGRTGPWSAALAEQWFSCSHLTGASPSLMESFWLLQAASSHKEESSKTESELTSCLSELYQRKFREECTAASQEDSRKKRGVPRTPVRQKMNTMCRSLKMLNVARLNVKAQRLCPDGSPNAAGEKGTPRTAGGRGADKLENRGRTLRSSKPKDFKTEEELLSYIHENYQKTVATGEIVLHSCARNMISTIKAFLKSKGTKELEMNCLNRVKNCLLKTSKSLRQNLGKKLDKDKVRECRLQVLLRLEMCLQCPSACESGDDVEQVVKEVTDLLRMVCLTEDSAYLAKFLEEILGLYIDSIPKMLGMLYDSLGFMIPQKLAGVLPLDFFSDDSVTHESRSPLLSVPLASGAPRPVSGGTESDRLEELRTRSAKKRRKNALIRHKSIAEVSQNLRQIEIPKVSKRATKQESAGLTLPQPPPPGKDPVQEVTKVRRNLFNQEMISPSKRSAKRGLPRSHSVSAVEGLECQLGNSKKTKGILAYCAGAVSSDPGPDIDIVEESPEKGTDEIGLRRSPRIKQLSLSRTHSGSFYSVSQPQSRSVQRVHSFQLNKSDQRGNSPNRRICSPKSLLFGALCEMASPSEKGSARPPRPSRSTVGPEIPTAYQTPKKSSQKSPSSSKATPRRFPRTPRTPLRTPKRRQRPHTEATPAKQAVPEESFKDASPAWASPSQPAVTPQRGRSLASRGTSPLEKKVPRTPRRPGAQPAAFPQKSTWPLSTNSSPESAPCPAAPSGSTGLRPADSSPQAAGAGGCRETPPERAHHGLRGSGASQARVLAQKGEEKAASAPRTPGSTSQVSPAAPPEKPFTLPSSDVSKTSPGQKFSMDPPSPGEADWSEPWNTGRGAPPLSGPALATPPGIPPNAQPAPAPPPKAGERPREPSDRESSFQEGQPSASAAPRAAPVATTATREDQKEAHRLWRDWYLSSSLLLASDTEYLTPLDEAELDGGDGLKSDAAPMREEQSRTVVAEKSSPASPGVRPSCPSCGPGSPLTPSYALRCTADRRQRQAAAQLENLQVSAWLPEGPASPQAYEVELEMRASGLPKLRLKKIDPGALGEAEPLRPAGGSLGDESSLPGLPQPGRSSGRPEATYTSPPCLRPSHSTPAKSGGQTYICQSCTPTCCPSSAPSPIQTDGGVPWTPSPKHSGKTPPDSIRDWPRRKRAVGGTCAGRSEGGADLPAGASLLSISRTPLLGDFELEGVCQLPDQSPPGDSVPKADEACSWGQFGLGSRKRLLPAEEEAECQAKRACDGPRDAELRMREERSPGAPHLLSPGDDEVFAPGSTPPPGCAVRRGLSASGLHALTQSPLLLQGRTPSSRCTEARDANMELFPAAEDSPFSRACSRRRPVGRTYTRKKLIS
uniref:TOPBP1 interacting checkpoint and replication regulator n=1 Tax=Suricata suricatta TaxID=37032 RepID=A0A673TL12_SURSU